MYNLREVIEEMLTVAEKIRVLLTRRDMNLYELSDALDISRQNLSNKMKRNNFTENDIKEIANVLGCDFEINFVDKESGEKL